MTTVGRGDIARFGHIFFFNCESVERFLVTFLQNVDDEVEQVVYYEEHRCEVHDVWVHLGIRAQWLETWDASAYDHGQVQAVHDPEVDLGS